MSNVIFTFVNLLFKVMEFSILIECILSWVMPYSEGTLIDIIKAISQPIMKPVRAIIRPLTGNLPIDISPIVAIFVIDLLRALILGVMI